MAPLLWLQLFAHLPFSWHICYAAAVAVAMAAARDSLLVLSRSTSLIAPAPHASSYPSSLRLGGAFAAAVAVASALCASAGPVAVALALPGCDSADALPVAIAATSARHQLADPIAVVITLASASRAPVSTVVDAVPVAVHASTKAIALSVLVWLQIFAPLFRPYGYPPQARSHLLLSFMPPLPYASEQCCRCCCRHVAATRDTSAAVLLLSVSFVFWLLTPPWCCGCGF